MDHAVLVPYPKKVHIKSYTKFKLLQSLCFPYQVSYDKCSYNLQVKICINLTSFHGSNLKLVINPNSQSSPKLNLIMLNSFFRIIPLIISRVSLTLTWIKAFTKHYKLNSGNESQQLRKFLCLLLCSD
jgi:hypothetical protein